MKTPLTLEFNSHVLRVVKIKNEPWLIAKDVLVALGASGTAVSQVGKQLQPVPKDCRLQHPSKRWCVHPRGLAPLLSKDGFPQAESFSRWLREQPLPLEPVNHADILPKPAPEPMPEPEPEPETIVAAVAPPPAPVDVDKALADLERALEAFEKALALTDKARLTGDEALLAANRLVEGILGVDYLARMGIKDRLATAQEPQSVQAWAQRFNVTERDVHLAFEKLGWQARYRNRTGKLEWFLTREGLAYGYYDKLTGVILWRSAAATPLKAELAHVPDNCKPIPTRLD